MSAEHTSPSGQAPLHVVIGAGPIGSAVAEILADSGARVRIVTRSGSGPERRGIERVAADAADAARLSDLTTGAVALYNCANPPYHRWATDWPPLAAAMLAAAQSCGAVLVTASNLYGYGPVSGPMRPDMPPAATTRKGRVRAAMWTDALAAHRAGRIRAVEVRGSDYVGPGAESTLGERVIPRLLAGKRVSVIGSADEPHSWTYTRDMAKTLVAAGTDPRAWGRAWHAPSNPPRTQREAIDDLAAVAGVPPVHVGTVPRFALRALGLVNPTIREVPEMLYQFTAAFEIDDSATRAVLGLQPTPWVEVLAATLRSYGAAVPDTEGGPTGATR